MINNVEDLIIQANEIEDKEARIKFIMNYFLENVQYNYSYLFATGYMKENISAVSNNFKKEINKTRVDGDAKFSLTRSVLKGESKIFNDILQIRDENSGEYSRFIEKLRNYITEELCKHIENEYIVDKSTEIVMQKIEQGLREKIKVKVNDKVTDMNYDISKILIDFLVNSHKFFPPEFNNGLITKGVCADYTKYLVSILPKVGIEAHNAEGTSELKHNWIIAKIGDEYKSIDLTRAVLIRDGFKGIPEEQTTEDWLYSNIEDIFKMQKTRSITKIDGKELPYVINGENYDKNKFKKMMDEKNITDSTLKNLSNKALENGVTQSETLDAEKEENTNEREDITNE